MKPAEIDRFINKDQNFSISWYPSLKDYYQSYLQNRLNAIDEVTQANKGDEKAVQEAAKEM